MGYIKSDDEFRVLAEPVFEPVRRDLFNEHDILKPSDPHDCGQRRDRNCLICDGGLAVCGRCGKYEAGLDEPCTTTAMTGEHDSQTCDAANGKPCEMCVAADEYEAREAGKARNVVDDELP